MLLYLTEVWKLSIDNGDVIGAMFINFRKAFDSVDHNILGYPRLDRSESDCELQTPAEAYSNYLASSRLSAKQQPNILFYTERCLIITNQKKND